METIKEHISYRIPNKPKYQILKDELLEYIKKNNLKPGDLFLSERQICKMNGVSSITARRTIRELQADGILYRRHGIGTFVGNLPDNYKANIGIVIYSKTDILDSRDYYLNEIIRGINKICTASKIKWRLFKIENGIDYFDVINRQKDLNGLIVIAPTKDHKSDISHFKQLRIPFIVVNSRFSDNEGIDFVDSDNLNGAFIATQYLISLGHRKIAIINGDMNYINSIDRFNGYRKALKEHRIKFNHRFTFNYSQNMNISFEEFAYDSVEDVLNSHNKPTAIFFTGFLFLLGGLKYCKEKNIKIPDDISVVSYDDFPELSLFTTPITTISQPILDIGRYAMLNLFKKIENRNNSAVRKILKSKLIIRESCKKIK